MTDVRGGKLEPRVERRRRLRTLALVVPALLNRHLKPLFGWRRWPFVLSMFLHARGYRERFRRADDDPGLAEVKRTFFLVGVLYNRLRDASGEEIAFRTASAFLFDLANAVQRQAYIPAPGVPRSWEAFHAAHEAQMEEGFIRNNENDGIVRTDEQLSFHITRCRFYEAFRDMGNAGLAEAFCRSDEVVFNEYSPTMRFSRGGEAPDTIARGAPHCTFVYTRIERKD